MILVSVFNFVTNRISNLSFCILFVGGMFASFFEVFGISVVWSAFINPGTKILFELFGMSFEIETIIGAYFFIAGLIINLLLKLYIENLLAKSNIDLTKSVLYWMVYRSDDENFDDPANSSRQILAEAQLLTINVFYPFFLFVTRLGFLLSACIFLVYLNYISIDIFLLGFIVATIFLVQFLVSRHLGNLRSKFLDKRFKTTFNIVFSSFELRQLSFKKAFKEFYDAITGFAFTLRNFRSMQIASRPLIEITVVLFMLVIYLNKDFFYQYDISINALIAIAPFGLRLMPVISELGASLNKLLYSTALIDKYNKNLSDVNKETLEEEVNFSKINKMRITQDNKDTEDWKIIFHNFNPQNNIESINFEINKGDKIVIKGESGIGKSTFLHNVFFQEKFQSNIKLECSKDYKKDFSPSFFFTRQDPRLFNGTMEENITLSREGDISKTIEIVDPNKNFFSDKQLSRTIDSSNLNFSGGEQQKILIARAIYTNADILIFDETLSALDINNLKKMSQVLLNYHKTIILVSHNMVETEGFKELQLKRLNK